MYIYILRKQCALHLPCLFSSPAPCRASFRPLPLGLKFASPTSLLYPLHHLHHLHQLHLRHIHNITYIICIINTTSTGDQRLHISYKTPTIVICAGVLTQEFIHRSCHTDLHRSCCTGVVPQAPQELTSRRSICINLNSKTPASQVVLNFSLLEAWAARPHPSKRDSLGRLCVSDAQGCDEMQNVVVRSIAPSHGMKAERQKLVQACNFETTDAILSHERLAECQKPRF